jgi:HSP20 family protein
MWEDDDLEIIEEIEKSIDTIFEEEFSSSVNWLFDVKRNVVKPLFKVEVRDTELIVRFDLPGVEKQDIRLSASEDTLSVEAKMKKPISLMVGGSLQKTVQFEKYAKKVRLPVNIQPDQGTAKVSRGMLTIRFPLTHKGMSLKVE